MKSKSSPRDDLLATHLASGMTRKAAGAKVGLHERTVRAKLEDPGFRARVDGIKTEIVSRAVAMLGKGMTTAARRLRKLATEAKSEAVQRAACKDLLEMAIRARSGEDVEKKIQDLVERVERLTADRNGSKPR